MSVYQNGTTANVNLLGRQKLQLRNIVFGSLYALTLNEEEHDIGTVFLKCDYWPQETSYFHTMWPDNLHEPSSKSKYFDKYEFFNEHL
jgi:hypothetical protein